MNPAPGEVRSARAQRVMPRGSGRWRSGRAKRRLLVIWLYSLLAFEAKKDLEECLDSSHIRQEKISR